MDTTGDVAQLLVLYSAAAAAAAYNFPIKRMPMGISHKSCVNAEYRRCGVSNRNMIKYHDLS